MEETWIDIEGYPYQVSSLGRVRRNNGNTLKTRIHQGYEVVNLSKHNRKRTFSVHCLVATAFHGSRPQGKQARHLDGNSLNNRETNLVWGTCLENARDKILHGTSGRGTTHYGAKLNDQIVTIILEGLKAGHSQLSLSREYGVRQGTISAIALGKTWVHVPRP